jgi:hypothetical protein
MISDMENDQSLQAVEGGAKQRTVGFRFFALPAHLVVNHPATLPQGELVEPDMPFIAEGVERALSGAEFRDVRARDRLRTLLLSDTPPPLGSLGKRCGPAAVFARPPDDLPALLRLADQLDKLAVQEAGEKALVWKCECGTRYAVPVALVRQVSIKCERCGRAVELNTASSQGEESLLDPFQGAVNVSRHKLAEFFREAMARGWPVLVCTTES